MLTLLLLLVCIPQTPQEPFNKALMIGIDGLRPDCLIAADTPALDGLAASGILKLDARTTSITSSGPAWATLLTGARMSMHGVRDNSFTDLRLGSNPTWLAQIEMTRPELFTASIVQWKPIHEHLFPKGSIDSSSTVENGAALSRAAVSLLSDAKKNVDALFLHFDDVDHAGHAHGYGVDVPEYIAAIEKVDGQIGEIMKTLRSRLDFEKENWLVLVGTDHGGMGKGHGADIPECRTVFMLAGGKGAAGIQWRENAEIHDFAPRALQHFRIEGARIPTSRMETPWWSKRHSLINQRTHDAPKSELLFIGDSITHFWENAGARVWAKRFMETSTLNLGIAGDRTEHLLWRLRNGNLTGLSPKVAVLMIGSNNAGQLNQEPTQTFLGIQAIVAELQFQLPQTKILLLGIFPRGAKADDPHRVLNREVNGLLAPWADTQAGVYFLNINLRFLTENATLAPEIMPDLLHPNERGYQIWADAIESKLSGLLNHTDLR